uniref:Cell division control protein 48 homolog A-like n=1 Tax=Dermatophagoides pteronyssinus TaxID=6956 RepID=A0A6P6Y9Y7_DERPT|nr:cell division control protein 48 homolog A-like [Dermatophagoides pteronyssinus]
MIDEIDALCPKRNNLPQHKLDLVNTFLSCLDGPFSHPSTFVIGTTNKISDIDEAIRRPGRIDREIEIPVPDTTTRKEILRSIFNNNNVSEAWMTDDKKLDQIVTSCSGFVATDLLLLVRKGIDYSIENSCAFSHEILLNLAHKIYPSALKELIIEIPNVNWSSIIGYDEIKQKLKEAVEWPILYKSLFAKYSLKPSSGILLYGPPGNSKTTMAKCIATESSMNFISIKGPEIFSMWVGESERKLREIFSKARKFSPSIIFIDEIDSIGKSRGFSDSSSSSMVESRILSQLLNEMDGLSENDCLIVIGATNKPTDLDSALLRPGRFDNLIYVPLPDDETRKKIFIHNNMSPTDVLIKKTKGYSGAELFLCFKELRMEELRQELKGQSQNVEDSKTKFIRILNKIKPRTSDEVISYFDKFVDQFGLNY